MTIDELSKIISETRKYNFHTHTPWCDGRDTPQSMVSGAIASGMTHLGFSPHSPIPIESPCNMSMDDVPSYRKAIEQLRQKFVGQLQLYTGMEVDYLHGSFGPSSAEIVDLGLDYAIGSVHFIPRKDNRFVDIDGNSESFKLKMVNDFNGDVEYVVKKFYEASHEMILRGGFEILGHADKVAQNAGVFRPGIEQEGWYQDIINEYLDAVIKSGLIVELNTKIRSTKGRFFPHERFWQRLVDAHVPLMVNSDAHYADKLNSSREEAFEILDSYGLHIPNS